MKRKSIIVVLSMVLLCVLVFGLVLVLREEARPVADSELDGVLSAIFVRATVVSTDGESQAEAEGVLEVTHVFKGPEELVGKKFAAHKRQFQYGGGGYFLAPMAKGLAGIYALKSTNGKLHIAWGWSYTGITLPSWEGFSDRFKQVEAAAQAIEAVVKARPMKRLSMLKEYARSVTPEVAICAVNIMGSLDDREVRNYLRGLPADKTLTVAAQVAVDEVLSGGDAGVAWQASQRRKHLLGQWVSGETDEYDASVVRTRVDLVAQHPGGLDYETILGLVKTAMENEGMPVSVRRNYLYPLRWIYERSELGDECFGYLVELVSENKHNEIRQGAAYAIRNFVDLDQQRVAVLEQIMAGLKDQQLRQILLEAINQKSRP